MKKIFYLILVFSFTACGVTEETTLETVTLRVNSHTVACSGEMDGECLLVQEGDAIGSEDWEYFYYWDGIEGFEYEPGFVYDLLVRKIPVKNPPMDSSSIRYELVRILSKVEQ